MKVIERKPLRQRGRNADKRQATKEAIRDVYANGAQKAVQILLLIILPNSLLSKETQKVACIFDPENAKTVAGTVLMTAPTAVFPVFWPVFAPKRRKNLFCLGRQKRFL